MIDILESKYVKEKTPEQVFSVLESLSQVKRIDMLIMFLSKKHQQGKARHKLFFFFFK